MLVKRIFFLLIVTYVSCFWVQHFFSFFTVKPLEGVKEIAGQPRLSASGFLRGTYQDSLNEYVNQNTGFRPSLVRVYNQINFSLFKATHAPGVVVGKRTHLFIESYILNYVGLNFVGRKTADENVAKIRTVQDSLKKFNVDLIVVFAPGKASYFPELIPDKYAYRKRDTSNYTYYSAQLRQSGVNFIDFNDYFCKNKNMFAYPVYPEFGTHWTSYAYALAFDSLLHYIAQKRNIKTVGFDYHRIYRSDSLREREYDIGVLLNLMAPLKHRPMPYVNYSYTYKPGSYRPDVLAVGDSYWWCMVGDDIPYHVFKEDVYWFYNRDVYRRNSRQDKPVADLSIANETANRDVIVLMATEATFDLFPYGFIDNMYDAYCRSLPEKIELVKNKILSDAAWSGGLRQKAKDKGISFEQQVQEDAAFIVNNKYTPVANPRWHFNAVITDIMNKIKSDGAWYEKIKQKARENHVSDQIQLEEDAWFIYNSEYGSDEAQSLLQDIRKRIMNTPEWKAAVAKKAIEKRITFEEMLELDAKFVYDSEHKKIP